MKEDESEQGIW